MFNPLSVPTEAEQAATQGAKSSYYGNLINAGVVSPEEVRQALRQDENSGFTDIAEDLPEDTGGGMGGGMPGNENGGQPPNGNNGGNEEGQPIGKDHQIIFNHGQFHKYKISEEELKKYNRPVPKPETKAQDSADNESNENWKTLYPNGKSSKGQKVKLNEEKEIEAGLGGEHNGETLQELAEGNGKPEEKKEEGEKEKQNESETEKTDKAGNNHAEAETEKSKGEKTYKHYKPVKGVMNTVKKHEGKPDGTYDIHTGEPKVYTSGYSFTFHQNEADENGNFKSAFGRYTEAEYDRITNEIAEKYDLEINIGVYGNPEVSFHCEDLSVVNKIVHDYYQESYFDFAAMKERPGDNYQKEKNPIPKRK